MTRAYRFMVTVYVEGDRKTLPDPLEMAEHVATQVQDEYNHNWAVCVRPIEIEHYAEIPKTTKVRVAAITDEQIDRLRAESADAGDLKQVAICERALDGSQRARRECARLRTLSVAQASPVRS